MSEPVQLCVSSQPFPPIAAVITTPEATERRNKIKGMSSCFGQIGCLFPYQGNNTLTHCQSDRLPSTQ